MINKKEQTLDMFYTISNEHDFDNEYIKQLARETKTELKAGRINSIEEAIEKMQKKYDEIYVNYMKEMLKESEEDIKNGNIMTIEESIERMKKKYEGFNIW